MFYLVSDESEITYFNNKHFDGYPIIYISKHYEIFDLLKKKGYSHNFTITKKT